MTNRDILDNQRALIQSLTIVLETESSHPVQIFETHISWVLVAENFSYKFKKAIHFDFLDYSTLDARHFYCQEELRLNRRLSTNLYLGVISIIGTPDDPLIDAAGTPIEYAVKMRSFSQQALWSYLIKIGGVSAKHIDELARKIAQFHLSTGVALTESVWGSANSLQKIADDNLSQIAGLAKNAEGKWQLDDVKAWQVAQQQKLNTTFDYRKTHGFIKECHGDLHSGNILTINDQVEVFDCIEFNESLRWIDVMSDIAFVCMDLQFQKRNDLAAQFLNQYLEISGDYDGLMVLRYYQIQRAIVRCKVALLRARQLGAAVQDAALHESQAEQYLAFSVESIQPAPAAIMITYGYSGSGKSTLSRCLVELISAIQIRSDIERKRMHGLAATARSAGPLNAGLYDSKATQITYSRLRTLARHIVESGMPVIVDAAFLRRRQRKLFEKLAHDLCVPFFILELRASTASMRDRIASRAQLNQDPSDAGLNILAHQIAQHDALTIDEMKHTIVVDTKFGMGMETMRKIADPIMRAMQRASVHHSSS